VIGQNSNFQKNLKNNQNFRTRRIEPNASIMYSIRGVFAFFVTLFVANLGCTLLYGACLQGIEALQYSGYFLREADAKHLRENFRPNILVFTLQKQQSFHGNVYDESEECDSCLRNFDELDGIFYTWDVVENVPTVYTHDGSIQIPGRKMIRQSHGPLYYLRHLRSCAISSQSHCSASIGK